MKKFYAILCLAIASLTQLQAQAPQGFNYQATVRNSTGDLVVNTNVYFKFNVIQGSNTAVPIFTETHYVPTDDLGQVNLVIGQGTANSGSFSALDWSLGSYYLGIELDTGSGYLAMGTTQLLSVPYALYAENSGNATSATPNLQSVLAENNSAGQQQIKDLLDPTDAQVWNDNTTISPEPNSFWFINADNTTIALPPLSNQGDVIKIYYMGAGFNNTPENSNYSEGFYTNIDAQTNEVFIGYFGIIEPYDEGFHYTFNEIIPFTLARGLNTFIQIGDYWMLGEAVPLPPQYIDNDGDGFSETEGDCDDTNASVNPGATEIEDGIDNDCDGQIDEGFELCTLETAESYSASNLNMTFQTDPSEDFISDGAGFSWIDNPDYDNTINSSCKVGQVVKGNNNPWDNNQYDLDAKLDFNVNSGLKIKVWSARPNTEVRIKLEEIGNPGNNNEQFLTTSVTSGWEELTFPFTAAESGKFDKIVIFFDLNANNTDTYYFDDLKLYGNGGNGGGGGGNGDCPEPPAGELLANGDFEAGDVGCWQFFPGTTISTTINNGGSQSAEIQGSTGVAVGLKMERFGTGLVTPNTSYTVSFDIIASDVLGEGGLVKAFTFSEGADGGTVAATQHVLTDNTTSVSTTAWETKTFTFTTPGNANQVEGGLSFLIEIVNSAARLNVDNISVRATP
jgi:hypothetical protein